MGAGQLYPGHHPSHGYRENSSANQNEILTIFLVASDFVRAVKRAATVTNE